MANNNKNGKLIINGEEVYELDEDCLIRGGVKTVGWLLYEMKAAWNEHCLKVKLPEIKDPPRKFSARGVLHRL